MHAWHRPRRLALAGIAAAFAVTIVASSQAVGRYTDPTGDGNGAPDITGVSVTSSATGQVQFTISAPGVQVGADTRIILWLNTDADPETGAPGTLGSEYFVGIDELENAYVFARWNGSAWAFDSPHTTIRVFDGDGTRTVSINVAELGGAQSINFWVRSFAGSPADEKYDDAPNFGVYNYALANGGPEIRGVLVTLSPMLGPQAGKPFTVKPMGIRLPPSGELVSVLPQPDSYRCKATLAGRALKGTGTGGCTFKLKKAARGKKLVIQLTVEYQGATNTSTMTYKVR